MLRFSSRFQAFLTRTGVKDGMFQEVALQRVRAEAG